MFERYNESARFSIFQARAEASYFGSLMIEPEHLLLGVLANDEFLRTLLSIQSIRDAIESKTPPKAGLPVAVDMLVSHEGKQVFAYAGEEADHLRNRSITCLHVALGLKRLNNPFIVELLSGLDPQILRTRSSSDPLT